MEENTQGPVTAQEQMDTRSRWKFALRLLLIGTPFCLLVAEAVRVFTLTNRHTVIENRVYRCSQPNGDHIREFVKEHRIRTIINLRGLSPDLDWYQEECRACHEAGISQEDITLSAKRLPPPSELRRLVAILDHAEYPILIHCKRGADRTGLVSTMVLLLQTDVSFEKAVEQLLPRYGHVRFGRLSALDEFFDMYRDWLKEKQLTHSSAHFRNWVSNEYKPGVNVSELAWIDPMPKPAVAGESYAVRVRMTNRSNVDWHLKPGTYAGIHLCYSIFDTNSKLIQGGRRALRQETVPPGGATEASVPIHGLAPGSYKVVAEIHDATGAGIPFRTNSFGQHGDESLAADLVVK